MSNAYRAVNWSRQKKLIDMVLLGSVALFLVAFALASKLTSPTIPVETLIIRGAGVAGFALLHVVLLIGPLSRMDRRFLPLLYNRRHLGVMTCLLGATHAFMTLVQYQFFADVGPIAALLSTNQNFGSITQFPFELFGVAALAILIVMAVTSHDFWLANLSAPAWKRIHQLVIVAYLLLVAHVSLGILQNPIEGWVGWLAMGGAFTVATAHLAAGAVETRRDRRESASDRCVEVDAGPLGAIGDGRAVGVMLCGERVAVFRSGNDVHAISAVCQHQNGPLDEGRIIDGLVTCPWHGYQYCPKTGKSPPPFSEQIPTFQTRIVDGRVKVMAPPHTSDRESA